MIINKYINSNLFLIILFYLGGLNESVQNQVDQLKTFHLHQNYPIPFNPSTYIQYAVGNKQFVQLKAYDVLGNEVATFVSEVKPACSYEVAFDGTGLPSGIYFYQLKTDSYIETRKIVLMK